MSESTPSLSPENPPQSSTAQPNRFFGFYSQFAVGSAVGVIIVCLAAAIGIYFPNRFELLSWILIFCVVWVCLYFTLRHRWHGLLIGFGLGFVIAYFVVTKLLRSGIFVIPN